MTYFCMMALVLHHVSLARAAFNGKRNPVPFRDDQEIRETIHDDASFTLFDDGRKYSIPRRQAWILFVIREHGDAIVQDTLRPGDIRWCVYGLLDVLAVEKHGRDLNLRKRATGEK